MSNQRKNIILILILALIFVIVLEISLNYSQFGLQYRAFEYDESLVYVPKSNYLGEIELNKNRFLVRTNEKRLRDFREYSYDKPENIKRIVLLGDSCTFGTGVDLNDYFPEILRNKFGKEI